MFTTQEIKTLKKILENSSDEDLFEIFGKDILSKIKEKLQKKEKQNKPYEFRQHFPDIK